MDDDLLLNFAAPPPPRARHNPPPKQQPQQQQTSYKPAAAPAPAASRPQQQQQRPQQSSYQSSNTQGKRPQAQQQSYQQGNQGQSNKRPRTEANGSASATQRNGSGNNTNDRQKPVGGRRQHLSAGASSSNGNEKGAASSSGPHQAAGQGQGQAPAPGQGQAGQHLSSLFTGVSLPRIASTLSSSNPSGPSSNAPLTGPVTFSTLGLHPLLCQHLASAKLNIGDRPTDIQRKVLPHLLRTGLYDDASSLLLPPASASGTAPPAQAQAPRDVLVASQTGSGKTLAFLLPILHALIPLGTLSFMDRTVAGTLAIILTPTRELARQIYEVLEKLVNLPLRMQRKGKAKAEGGSEDDAEEDDEEEEESERVSRWIVPALLCGGSTKNHEKTRLRKGCTIVVATPGRLLDHLQNTSAFDVGKLRWLVLDEADRLLELGFKETLDGIVRALEGRRRIALQAAREAKAVEQQKQLQKAVALEKKEGDEHSLDHMGVRWWAGGRRTVLCSATIDENVQMLAGSTLRNPLVVRGHGRKEGDEPQTSQQAGSASTSTVAAGETSKEGGKSEGGVERFAAPSQLRQRCVLVPPKLRLVSLLALIRQALTSNEAADGRNNRVIVFMSCTDSVDFHWNAMGGLKMGDVSGDDSDKNTESGGADKIVQTCEILPGCAFYRLHGSMSQPQRIASLKAFGKDVKSTSEESKTTSVLFCTSVASRGLDLPSVSNVIQLDAPTEGGVEEYVHRVGRTARVGKQGQSWVMLLPHERPILKRYQDGMFIDGDGQSKDGSVKHPTIAEMDFRDVLLQGFGGVADEYEARATDVQLALERWVLRSEDVSVSSLSDLCFKRLTHPIFSPSKQAASLARSAFLSHMRAYATHPASEKAIFSLRDVHLGHLAKSFALREAPATVKSKARSKRLNDAEVEGTTSKRKKAKLAKIQAQKAAAGEVDSDQEDSDDEGGEGYAGEADRSARGITSKDELLKLARKFGDGNIDANAMMARNKDAEEKMYAAVRRLGKQSKQKGQLRAMGADEFQIA